MQIWLCHS